MPKFIYNLDKTNFNKLKWYSNTLFIISLIIIIVGLLLKFIGEFNISSKPLMIMNKSSTFLIIPLGLLLLFTIFILPINEISSSNKLKWVILSLIVSSITLFLLNTIDESKRNINIPWELMTRSYKLQLALAIISLGIFWLFSRNITIPALIIFIIVGLNIITLITSGTTIITSIVEYFLKFKDYKVNIKTVEDIGEISFNIISGIITTIIGIILIINIWNKEISIRYKITSIITIILIILSFILSFIEPKNYESINKFIISVVTGNFVLENILKEPFDIIDNNIYNEFVNNLQKIVKGDDTNKNSNTLTPTDTGLKYFMKEIFVVVKYTILSACMNDATINTLSPVFTRTLLLFFTYGDDLFNIISSIIKSILTLL